MIRRFSRLLVHRQYNNPMAIQTYQETPLTTIYHKAPLQVSDTNQFLIFIPGNPGLIDFYTTYLDLVQKKYPTLEILAISQAGFQTSDDYLKAHKERPFRFYNLEYQIEHKLRIIKQFVNQSTADVTELLFLSHSVGCYMTQRITKKLLKDPQLRGKVKIKFIGLITPTIVDIATSESGQLFTRLFDWLPAIQLVLFFVTILRFILPTAIVHKIIDHAVIAKPNLKSKDAIESWENSKLAAFKIFLSNSIIKQALTLAREELIEIHKHEEVNQWFFNELSQTTAVKIWSFFAIKDHWVHDSTRDYILSTYHDSENKNLKFELGNIDSEVSPAITHSFCVDQSVEFSEITCQALSEVL